jgi:hypothetical protein
MVRRRRRRDHAVALATQVIGVDLEPHRGLARLIEVEPRTDARHGLGERDAGAAVQEPEGLMRARLDGHGRHDAVGRELDEADPERRRQSARGEPLGHGGQGAVERRRRARRRRVGHRGHRAAGPPTGGVPTGARPATRACHESASGRSKPARQAPAVVTVVSNTGVVGPSAPVSAARRKVARSPARIAPSASRQ